MFLILEIGEPRWSEFANKIRVNSQNVKRYAELKLGVPIISAETREVLEVKSIQLPTESMTKMEELTIKSIKPAVPVKRRKRRAANRG